MPTPEKRPEDLAKTGDQTSLTLLERLHANEADAWVRLVRLYRPLVAYWCGRGGVVGADADDVIQELFHTAAVKLPEFRRDRPGDTFRGWLRGITRNLLLAHARQAAKQPRAAGGTDAALRLREVAEPEPPADDEDPSAEVNELYRQALEQVRGEFEERTWQAFVRTAVDGRNATETAAELGLSSASVRQAKSRVLRRLRQELGELID
jgi:RNA polymerase sigma-70 factor (ECF subfamily)